MHTYTTAFGLRAHMMQVRFFAALMAMPSSWALYKAWVWTMSVYFAFNALWWWSTLKLEEDEELDQVCGFDTSTDCPNGWLTHQWRHSDVLHPTPLQIA